MAKTPSTALALILEVLSYGLAAIGLSRFGREPWKGRAQSLLKAWFTVRVFWLLLEREQVDLCLSDPGFDVDLHVAADLATMARVWLGDLPFESALRARKLELLGSRELMRAFPTWWLLSPYAGVPRPPASPGRAAREGSQRRRPRSG